MSNVTEQHTLLSHAIAPEDVATIVQTVSERIKREGDKEHVSVQRQLELLHELSQFDFGRFLLRNKGIDAYWSHYFLMHPRLRRKKGENYRGEQLSSLESFLLELAPATLATQERFEIFLKENQRNVRNGAKLACIPSGMMGELLYLNFEGIDDIKLVGLDYDSDALEDAKILAEKQKLSQFVDLTQRDAWQLDIHDEFDLISSNGLNIYEPDDNKVTELYRQFYKALKMNGKLVTSFVTYPPYAVDHCEWSMDEVNQQDLLLQRILFADILNAKWQCFRSTQKTKEQFSSVGFSHIRFLYDKAHIFPTVIATK